MNNLRRSYIQWYTIFRCGILLLTITGSLPVFGQDSLAEAKRYYNHEEYTKAVPIFEKYAERGNSDAQHKLGFCYQEGKRVTTEVRKSSLVVNGKIQTPTTIVSTKLLGSWKSQPLFTK